MHKVRYLYRRLVEQNVQEHFSGYVTQAHICSSQFTYKHRLYIKKFIKANG